MNPPSVLLLRVLGAVAGALAVVSAALAAAAVLQVWPRPRWRADVDLEAAVLVATAALVALVAWVWIARRNAGLLAPGRPFRFGPLTAAFAVALPVSHLWWVRPVLLETALASAPSGETAAAVRLVRSWWACLIGGVGAILVEPTVTLTGYRLPVTGLPVCAELALRFAPVPLLPAAAVLFALLLGRIGRWQAQEPVVREVAAPAAVPPVGPAARVIAVGCAVVAIALLVAAGVAALVNLNSPYLLPEGRPIVGRHAATNLITAAAVAVPALRLALSPPAGARMLVTVLCWTALLGLAHPRLFGLPGGWGVAGALQLVASAVTSLVAADRVDRSAQPKNALRRWLSSR